MSETLGMDVLDNAAVREAAYNKYYKDIFAEYSTPGANQAAIRDKVVIYNDEHDLSQDPREQGRVDAYQAFLNTISRQ